MRILGLNASHDSSVCVIEDGKLVYYNQEERLNHKKHSHQISHIMTETIKKFKSFDCIAVTATTQPWIGLCNYPTNDVIKNIEDVIYNFYNSYYYNTRASGLTSNNSNKWLNDVKIVTIPHHMAHAASAFYQSGFKESSVLVADGGGSFFLISDDRYDADHVNEILTTYTFKDNDYKCHFKAGYDHEGFVYWREQFHITEWLKKVGYLIEENPTEIQTFSYYDYKSLGHAFNITAGYWARGNPGTLMALAAYGSDTGLSNISEKGFFLQGFLDTLKNNIGKIKGQDAAWALQEESYNLLRQHVLKLFATSESKNLCLSGGFFNNVVNNAKLQKEFGDDYNIFIDPMCSDNGTCIGAAMVADKYYGSQTEKYINNVYLGTQADYNIDFEYHDKIIKNVKAKDVAKLIAERNPVALYQGKAEAGFRALGNRSLLYDPRDPDGQMFINKLKGREKFRPFAASVLYENAHEWFDMIGLHESQYMMYSLKCKHGREKLIPAVMHRDNTCRIQTVTEQTNKKYYELIQEFYNITGIPMVLNTSLNLAGDTIADNMKDAIDTCVKGGIQYLYCPEKNMIINFKR